MSFLLNLLGSPKVTAVIAVACLIAGWHAHTIYDGYVASKEKTKVIDNLGKGQNEIIKFNGALDKARAVSKDDCLNKSIDPAIRLLLNGAK